LRDLQSLESRTIAAQPDPGDGSIINTFNAGAKKKMATEW
jgi:hypothetical protein